MGEVFFLITNSGEEEGFICCIYDVDMTCVRRNRDESWKVLKDYKVGKCLGNCEKDVDHT